MFRMTVQYETPSDPAAFDAHYFDTHVRLCNEVPGLRAATFLKPEAVAGGTVPYLVAQLEFDDREAFATAQGTPEMAAAGADAAALNTPNLVFVGEVRER